MRTRIFLVGTILVMVVLAAACGTRADRAKPTAATAVPTAAATSAALTGKISVFAASSLSDVFKAVGVAFTKANPGVTVEFNNQSSSALATQIEQAAPADVFASADNTNMQRLLDKGLIAGVPANFVRNRPMIVIPADNKAQITTPKDLSKAGVKLVLAGPDVPIGNYARQIIDKLAADPAYGVAYKDATLKNLVSNEANVRATLTKIELGEADACFVYKTDVLVSGSKVKTVAIPDAANVIATYQIAVVKFSQNAKAAAAFIAFIRSAEGRKLLADAGFDPVL